MNTVYARVQERLAGDHLDLTGGKLFDEDGRIRDPAELAGNRITLGILSAVSDREAVSQRHLSRELGIALGLANAYIKRCVHKGLVKISQAPPNRYAYYLTPKGFAEKSRLTVEYLGRSFEFYREARNQIEACFDTCCERGYRHVALCGAGELAEIAVLVATQHAVELVGVIDERAAGGTFFGLPVVGADDLQQLDAVVLTDLRRPQLVFQALRQRFRDERILVAPLLRVSRDVMLVEDES